VSARRHASANGALRPASCAAARRTGRRNARGFSLLEVLFAMTLFALVGTAVNVLAIQSMRHTLHNYHGTYAVLLAQQQVENLESADYATIANSNTVTTINGLNYTVNTNVATDTPASGMKQVTVTITWTGLEGNDSYAVQTIFTQLS